MSKTYRRTKDNANYLPTLIAKKRGVENMSDDDKKFFSVMFFTDNCSSSYDLGNGGIRCKRMHKKANTRTIRAKTKNILRMGIDIIDDVAMPIVKKSLAWDMF